MTPFAAYSLRKRWVFLGRVPPHPDPLPWGEGAPSTASLPTRSARFADSRSAIPPLSEGEGRGEGEQYHRTVAADQYESGALQAEHEILVALDIPVRSNVFCRDAQVHIGLDIARCRLSGFF
jgi:hypothetical protein